MAVILKSRNGRDFTISPRYWSFFLTLAQVCEWKPAGTKRPADFNPSESWDGNYESCDDQIVGDVDAKEFSNGLNRCFYSNYCLQIMGDVATHIESQVEQKTGLTIPKDMKIQVGQDLRIVLGNLMAFSFEGEFQIS